MPSCRTLLRHLKDVNGYLSSFRRMDRSWRFEELVCQAFAGVLYLPYYEADSDDSNVEHRVTWLGRAATGSKAPGGRPDGLACGHGFWLVIEATRKTGAKQWSQEFARCLEHARDVARSNRVGLEDFLVVLVTQSLHQDTHQSVKSHNVNGRPQIVLLEAQQLADIIETAALAFTLRHLEVRKVLVELLRCTERSSGILQYRQAARATIEEWQTDVLELEKNTVLAIRSYRAMIQEKRQHVGVSEIFRRLTADPVLKWYFGRAEQDFGPGDVAKSLLQESLGAVVGRLMTGEELFSPVPIKDFRSRCRRRISAVEGVHGGS